MLRRVVEPANSSTAADDTYAIIGLEPGTYWVCAAGMPGYQTVVVEPHVTSVDFTTVS